MTPGGEEVRKAAICGGLVSVLVEAPEGVQATERVVTFFPPGPVETLTLRRLQEALLGHTLFPLAPALHGEGFRRQRGQQLQG